MQQARSQQVDAKRMLKQKGLMRPSGQRHCKWGIPASSVETAVAQIPIAQVIARSRIMLAL